MDEQKIAALQKRAAALRGELDALVAEAGDFPAMARNAERIKASLAMICLGLGLDAEGGKAAGTEPA